MTDTLPPTRPNPKVPKVEVFRGILSETDQDGTEYRIVDGPRGFPIIQVFPLGDALMVRQQYPDYVGVIEMSLGQAYDLLTAVSRALDIPVKSRPTSVPKGKTV